MGRFTLLAVGAVVGWALVEWRPFRVEVSGASMAPALLAGDWVLAARAGTIRRGDVVVLVHPLRPRREMVKRVTGVPGDELAPDRRLGPDEWFVAGDNPGASTDSRELGPVPSSAISGRVLFVYWPPERAGLVR